MKITDEMIEEVYAFTEFRSEAREAIAIMAPLILEAAAQRAETCIASTREGIAMQIRQMKDEP